MTKPEAEEKKELGNKAFASKDYDAAITHYTGAIRLDFKNAVYFSNRSASHGGKHDWESAASDAKECIRLDPAFLKGYYRLAAAQSEQAKFDEALSTVKQGLSVDPDNAQLTKQLRLIKAKRKAVRDARAASNRAAAAGAAAAASPTLASSGDASVSKEVLDLRVQLSSTTKEYRVVQADINRARREKRSAQLTKTELEKLPQNCGAGGNDARMYRGVGKMFVLASRSDVLQRLDESVKTEEKAETDLVAKADYLERRMKSQHQNIQELTKVATTE